MTKNVWVQPQTTVQQFTANEYVAACGETGTKYIFQCTGGSIKVDLGLFGTYDAPITNGKVYLETNGDDGLQDGDAYLSGYHACNERHEADTTDEFLNGYLVVDILGFPIKSANAPVIVWRGENGDNTHCTSNLDMNHWETTKS